MARRGVVVVASFLIVFLMVCTELKSGLGQDIHQCCETVELPSCAPNDPKDNLRCNTTCSTGCAKGGACQIPPGREWPFGVCQCAYIQLGISEPQDGLNKCCGVLSGFGSCTPQDPVENDQCEAACKEAHCSKGGRCTEPWGACECKC